MAYSSSFLSPLKVSVRHFGSSFPRLGRTLLGRFLEPPQTPKECPRAGEADIRTEQGSQMAQDKSILFLVKIKCT